MKMNRWIMLLLLAALAIMVAACGSMPEQTIKKPVKTPVVREEAPTPTPTPKPIPSPAPKLEPLPRQEQAPEPETEPVKPGVPSAPLSTGKAILVSLPQQWLYAYENGKLVFDHAVETGRPELPTPTGSFTVMDKVRDVMFTSPWPEGSPYYYDPTPVSYGLLFKDGGFFLHDASWHELFGPGSNVPHQLADGRWETGSHGCVGMRVPDAERLYHWAPIGAPVIVTGQRGYPMLHTASMPIISVPDIDDSGRRRFSSQERLPGLRSSPLTIGESEVQVYTHGEKLYADMLSAIRQARECIVFETFIWKDDAAGRRFKQELLNAAERGVQVFLIFDGFANLVVPRRFKRFAPSPNLFVLEYPLLPWPWHPFHLRSYARNHRKLMVVDGQIAFVGGYNIGSRYETEWRDTHVRIQGPAAWEIENVFIDFWNAHSPRRLPRLADRETRDWDPRITVYRNDPHLMIFPIRNAYLEAIDRAQQHIYLTHAYFIPDRAILQRLLAAAARGVDVRILLPETSNHQLADWLARGYYRQCLESGIRLLLFQRMVHAKTATIDGIWSTVGTANIDRLSLIGNFEVNAEFYDEALAQQMEHIFHADASNARELTLEEWQRRPLHEKLAETLLLPLRPLL